MQGKKASAARLMVFVAASVFSTAQAAAVEIQSGPLKIVSAGNFIKADDIPWQSVCEWTDETGKAHAIWTVGLERPGADVVPASVLCVTVKRFIFSNGRGFAESHFQRDRTTALQQGHTSSLMYILAGHGRNMVDNQTMESGPGDALIQVAEKVHQNAAVGEGYVQIATILPNVGPNEGIKTSDADLARPNLVKHDDAPKSELCLFTDASGTFQTVRREPGNAAVIPANAACVTIRSLISRPNGKMTEITSKKGTKTALHAEPMDVLVYVVKGGVRATIGNETQDMKAGEAMFQPGGVVRSNEFMEDSVEVEIRLPKESAKPAVSP